MSLRIINVIIRIRNSDGDVVVGLTAAEHQETGVFLGRPFAHAIRCAMMRFQSQEVFVSSNISVQRGPCDMLCSFKTPETYLALRGHAYIRLIINVRLSQSSESINSRAPERSSHDGALTVCLLMWPHRALAKEIPAAW